jgi:parallel beta-helix repeat protein
MANQTGILFQNPIVKPLSPNGQFMSGCTATFFLTGTTTLTPIFADGGLTTPLANPLSADASGTFSAVYLDPSVVYRIQIKTSTGVLISDTDPYIPSSLNNLTQGLIGQTLYPKTAAETAASITPTNFAYVPGDVRRYGAACDGNTNDTTAINNALLCNDYVWITNTSVASGVQMTLDGQMLFGIGRASGIIALNNTTPCITLSGNRQVVRDLILGTGALAANDTNTYTVTGITQAGSAVVTINTVSASNPVQIGQGVYIQGVVGMTQMNLQQVSTVTAIGGVSGAWTATININSSAFTAYASGGVMTTTGFIGVQLAVGATRCTVERVATSGVWCYGISLENALYSSVIYCNIDGFRKRGINVMGGGDNRVLFNMVFDNSLVAPTDAHIYLFQPAAIHVRDNLITRSSSGPAINAINPAGSFLGQLLWITDNVIDNGNNWSIQVNNYFDLHINGNWCSWGQSTGSTGQINLISCQKFYVRDNDVYGSLVQGVGIQLTTCNNGIVSGNTVEYNYNGIVVTNCSNVVVSENIGGQLTGLPPSGVPTQNSYVEVGCSTGCQVYWVNNISFQPVVAAYSGITNTVVTAQGYTNSQFRVATGNTSSTLADRNGTVEMNSATPSTYALTTNTFSGGDEITVMASQATVPVTITFTGGALFLANGTNTSGTRTLTGAGYAKIKFQSANIAMISGTGLT